MYLIESEKVVRIGTDPEYRFNVRITNTADAVNSIVQTSLQVEYARAGSYLMRLSVPQNVSHAAEVLSLPKQLQPREQIAGWVTFTVPSEMLAGARIETLTVAVEDALGNISVVRPIVIPHREI